jgi:hypothetical protein
VTRGYLNKHRGREKSERHEKGVEKWHLAKTNQVRSSNFHQIRLHHRKNLENHNKQSLEKQEERKMRRGKKRGNEKTARGKRVKKVKIRIQPSKLIRREYLLNCP